MEAPKVRIADTVGAGDAFAAALAMGLLEGRALPDIHERATRLAAFVCTQEGAMPDASILRRGSVSRATPSNPPPSATGPGRRFGAND
jgi:sugar/nucleoside kinase (ribokinase family)